MLYIELAENYETMKRYVGNVSGYFDAEYEEAWFKDDFIRRVIREVDETEVLNGNTLYNETLGQIPPQWLSSGCKGLILLYKEGTHINGDRLGDNCISLLLEIADSKDITISLRHIPKFPEKFNAVIINSNRRIGSFREYVEEFVEVNG